MESGDAESDFFPPEGSKLSGLGEDSDVDEARELEDF